MRGPALFTFVVLVLVACVGADPAQQPVAGGPSPGASDSGTAADQATSPSDASTETPVSCEGGTTNCLGVCADLSTSGAHCGACGHDCGGGLCATGVCQPMVVRDGLNHPAFDIDGSSVYFQQDEKLLACPLEGCGKLAPRQVGALAVSIHGADTGFLRVSGGNVFFMADAPSGTSGPDIDSCAVTGCTTPPTRLTSASHQSFNSGYAVDGGDFYWSWYKNIRHVACSAAGTCSAVEDVVSGAASSTEAPLAASGGYVYMAMPGNTSVLQRCLGTNLSCVPTTIGTMPRAIVQLAARGDTVWILSSGGDGYNDGSVRTCPGSSVDCTGNSFAGNLPFPTAFTVDANAVSWVQRSGLNGADLALVTCPSSGCIGGPRVLADKTTGASDLRSNDAFVYWANDTQILRVAK